MMDMVYGTQQRWRGFRTPPLIRIIKREEGLLAPTNGEPRVYINIEARRRRGDRRRETASG